MRWFLIFFITVYLSLHYYIFYRISNDLRFSHGAAIWFLLAVSLLAFFGIVSQFFLYRHVSGFGFAVETAYIWMGLLSITVTFLFLGNIMFLFFKSPQAKFYITSAALIFSVITAAYSYINVKINSPVIKNISINIKGLDGKFKIVQLSDVHINSFTKKDEIKNIISKVNDLEPDVVVITGDLADSDLTFNYKDYGLDAIQSKYGIFVISGNHEYYRGIEKFENFIANSGFTLLDNKNALVNDSVYFAGISDYRESKRFDQNVYDFKKAFENVDFSKPVIFLSHQPEAFKEASKYPFALQLSGHTHAGQIPPFDIIEKIMFKHFYGLYDEGGSRYVYVTSGTRWWGPAMRLFIKSEIVLITLYGK